MMQSQYNLGAAYAMGKIMVAGAGGVENVVAEKWFDMASDKEMVKRQIDKLRIKRDMTLWDEAAAGRLLRLSPLTCRRGHACVVVPCIPTLRRTQRTQTRYPDRLLSMQAEAISHFRQIELLSGKLSTFPDIRKFPLSSTGPASPHCYPCPGLWRMHDTKGNDGR